MANVSKLLALWLCSFTLLATTVFGEETPQAEIVDVRRIWDQAPHNAFTDLLRHDGKWYCVFREGARHVSPDGALRILTSTDGETWTSAALVTSKTADLRDAKITVTPEGKLMLCGAGALHQPAAATHQTFVWFSDNGRDWSEALPIGDPNYWIWRVVWHKGTAYGIGYRTGTARGIRLYKSDDGRNFSTLVPSLSDEGYPNETALLFQPDGTCLCVLRRDGDKNDALLGTAQAPYTDWTWKSFGIRVGGPQMLALPDGRIVVAGRRYPGGARTQLWWLDSKQARLEEIVTLPSGGDTSYPGLVVHEGRLWVSYYSSHEGKTSIYLARVKLPAIAAPAKP